MDLGSEIEILFAKRERHWLRTAPLLSMTQFRDRRSTSHLGRPTIHPWRLSRATILTIHRRLPQPTNSHTTPTVGWPCSTTTPTTSANKQHVRNNNNNNQCRTRRNDRTDPRVTMSAAPLTVRPVSRRRQDSRRTTTPLPSKTRPQMGELRRRVCDTFQSTVFGFTFI